MDNAYLIAAAWIGLALVASLVSIRLGISVALIEIGLGVLAGNAFGLGTTEWIDFLAAFGAVLLTFLAGAEIEPAALRRHARKSLAIGLVSFGVPFLAAWAFALFVVGWDPQAAQIAGISLSTTSVAVVYAVMIQSGLADEELGKLILAACFITDLGTVLALGILFADFSPLMIVFGGVTLAALVVVPRLLRWFLRHLGGRVSEPEIKFLFLSSLDWAGWPRRRAARRCCRRTSSVWPSPVHSCATGCSSTACGPPPSRCSRRSTSSRPGCSSRSARWWPVPA